MKRCKLELEEAESLGHTERPAGEGLENATSSSTSISVQIMLGQDYIVYLQLKVSCLKSELVEVTLSKEAWKANNSMFLFYTGLPNWELLSVLYNFIKDNLSPGSSLTPFN